MGVVFTSLFALGLVLVVQAADFVDLDPGCVLYGAIELTPLDTVSVAGFEIPRAVVTLGTVAVLNLAFVLLFLKELKISSFDPSLATTTGFSASLMHHLLMMLVAVTAVASFESVGNILVVAMLIVPPAAAYLLTDRLAWMIVLSVVIGATAAVAGHLGALVVPTWFGYRSTTTAGSMAVAAGLIFVVAATLGPRHGILVKLVRRRVMGWGILAEDVIALLYRLEERSDAGQASRETLQDMLLADHFSLRLVLAWLRHRGDLARERHDFSYTLTPQGRIVASGLVRSHRLWEQYLVSQVGVPTDRIHDKAEQLEHFTDPKLRERLDAETDQPRIDPHGSIIPDEQSGDR